MIFSSYAFFNGGTMTLEEKINQDYVTAMKERNKELSSMLSFLRAHVKNVKIDKRVEQVSDDDVIAVLKKQVKQRQDSIAQFTSGGRPELAAKEAVEMDIIKKYLPAEMSVEALKVVIEDVIKETGASTIKDMGRVMKDVLARVKSGADNQTVGALVKERLFRV